MRAGLGLLLAAGFPALLAGQQRIEDNSFLVEEAYNQEPGVVQHVSTFTRAAGGEWEYGFSQEWPFRGQANQLSYSISLARTGVNPGGEETRFGDLAIHYRRQLLGIGSGAVALSPRLTMILPTGNPASGHGVGGVGVEGAVPLSLLLSNRVVVHLNALATVVPRASSPAGERATTLGWQLAGSTVLLLTSRFNLMLEAGWGEDDEVAGPGRTVRIGRGFLAPGFRYAMTTPGGLQVVPGFAYTVALGEDGGDDGLFFYLSLEHPFSGGETQR